MGSNVVPLDLVDLVEPVREGVRDQDDHAADPEQVTVPDRLPGGPIHGGEAEDRRLKRLVGCFRDQLPARRREE